MDATSSAIAVVVRRAIRDTGVSQAKIRGRIAVTTTTWKSRYHGQRPWSLDELARLSTALECSLVDLIQDAVNELTYDPERDLP